ncbi:MAG: glycosyltransferase family 4 protein [Chitinophagales bacterium]
MRILIISQYFYPESFRINDLAFGLLARGHKVTVLTGLPNYPSGRLFENFSWRSVGACEHEGVKVYRVPLIVRGRAKSWQLALNYISFAFFACLLGPFFCREKYDLVFVFEPSPFTVGLPGALFRVLKKAPLLFWVQDLWPESLTATGAVKSPLVIKWVGKMVRFIYRRCDRILLQSRGFRQPAIAAGADKNRIHYFPNWAEEIYQPARVELINKAINKNPSKFYIVFAGNLGVAQSLETLIGAANHLKRYQDIEWLIIGDGRREDWLHGQIKKNALENVRMLGRKPVASMPGYFEIADLLLVTLRKDPIFSLTIPSKIQSYLACGRPIVGALDGEGAAIINESGAGYATAAEDVEALAKSVLKLYRLDAGSRKKMGEAGRDYYNAEFNRSHLIEKLEKIMEEVVVEGVCES